MIQQVDRAVLDTLKDRLKEIFGYSQFRGDQEIIIKNILSPVSYTHLDVYKRQYIHSAGNRLLSCGYKGTPFY